MAHFVTDNMRQLQRRAIASGLGLCASALILVSCGHGSGHGGFAGYTPHERYEHGLRTAGLDQTALGQDWISAATRALESPVNIQPPYHEVSYLDAHEAGAVGYRVHLQRGQRIAASFELAGDTAFQVFIDMFVIPTGTGRRPILLTSADTLSHEMEYVARRDGDYLLRIQPELLRGGRYSVTIAVSGSLGFPVAGYDHDAIRSFWGDWRAGGRTHRGVDIFAPRGTPVVAATAGTVRSTRPNNLGGKVVWLRDRLGRSHYYAHLDSQVVRRGDRLQAGDTLGFVGNTGNARTTPPHLHFGISDRGWFDPMPALERQVAGPAPFAGEEALIGQIVRANRDRTRVRVSPQARSSIVVDLERHTPLTVVAGVGRWYRVSLPDGNTGFVEGRFVEPADQPIRSEVMANGALLRSGPAPTAAPTDSIPAGQHVPVLGAYGQFLFVQAPSGRAGWLALD